MAIDSQDKRRSAQGYGGFGGMLPVADGTVGTSDRPHAAWIYRGLTYGAAPAATSMVPPRGFFGYLRAFRRRLGV